MLEWEGVEDTKVDVPLIWFSRLKETDQWSPLRRCDCVALSNAHCKLIRTLEIIL